MASSSLPLSASSPLAEVLTSRYSAALYGAERRVNLSSLRIVWPSLLHELGATSVLRGAVACAPQAVAPRAQPFVYQGNGMFLNHAALLVHQPHACKSEDAVPSDSWVEATHCFFYNCA